MRQAKRIFVSYARRNEAAARSLIDALRQNSFSVVGDPKETSGQNWQEVTEEAIQSADAVIVLVASDETPTKYQDHEWSYTLEAYWADQTKLLIPVVIGDAALPSFLARFHALRVPDAAKGWSAVIHALQSQVVTPESVVVKDTAKLRERLKTVEDLAQRIKKGETAW
jgi:hypothetical protein